jgi:peptidyl-prolyl cis-trans isomerase B (cyclophilin B)
MMPQQPGPAPSRTSARKAGIVATVGLVVVGAIITAVVLANKSSTSAPATVAVGQTTSVSGSSAAQPSAPFSPLSSTPSAGAPQACATAASTSSEPVGYHACGVAARNVGIPSYNAAEAHRTFTVTLKTNRGDIVFTADGTAAPYTVYSFAYLAEKQYFDNTTCHRLTTSGIYVLQCGDPTGTGSGGPGYSFQDENLASLGAPGAGGAVTYQAGTVAMANSGPDTNGSQFFLVYKDSPIAPDYTPFGTITQGLDILQQIARSGTDDRYGSGDGAPKQPVQLESVTVQ